MSPKGRMLGANPPFPRRKSEATTHADGDSPPLIKEARNGMGNIKKTPKARSLKVGLVYKREMVGTEMRILPMFSQKRIFEDWILEIDCWCMMFGKWPISEVSGQMISM